jgi:hypothetical protein
MRPTGSHGLVGQTFLWEGFGSLTKYFVSAKNTSDEQFRDGPRKVRGSYKGFFLPRNLSKYRGNPNNIVFRSLMELRAMRFFDAHPGVLEWSSEETVIPYECPLTGKLRRYFVDFLVKMRSASGEVITYLIEVKPLAQVKQPEIPKKRNAKRIERYKREAETYLINEAKWAAATTACEKRKWVFKIITEKTLRF